MNATMNAINTLVNGLVAEMKADSVIVKDAIELNGSLIVVEMKRGINTALRISGSSKMGNGWFVVYSPAEVARKIAYAGNVQ